MHVHNCHLHACDVPLTATCSKLLRGRIAQLNMKLLYALVFIVVLLVYCSLPMLPSNDGVGTTTIREL